MNIENIKKRIKRLKTKLETEEKTNEGNLTFSAGLAIGKLKGKISALESVLNSFGETSDEPKKIYMIVCEWDMGFAKAYPTKEAAQKDIDDADWMGLCGMTQEEAEEDNYVYIEEIVSG